MRVKVYYFIIEGTNLGIIIMGRDAGYRGAWRRLGDGTLALGLGVALTDGKGAHLTLQYKQENRYRDRRTLP